MRFFVAGKHGSSTVWKHGLFLQTLDSHIRRRRTRLASTCFCSGSTHGTPSFFVSRGTSKSHPSAHSGRYTETSEEGSSMVYRVQTGPKPAVGLADRILSATANTAQSNDQPLKYGRAFVQSATDDKRCRVDASAVLCCAAVLAVAPTIVTACTHTSILTALVFPSSSFLQWCSPCQGRFP